MRKLWKLPKILFISLNRFKDTSHKDNSLIYINKTLNFNIGSIETALTNQIYNLQGLGLHYGNLMGGHYTALCDYEDYYYLYNDNIVKKYNKEDVYEELKKNNSAYLIIYELE
jgi:ubiquitin carboxyl-terminal hydrolase 8